MAQLIITMDHHLNEAQEFHLFNLLASSHVLAACKQFAKTIGALSTCALGACPDRPNPRNAKKICALCGAANVGRQIEIAFAQIDNKKNASMCASVHHIANVIISASHSLAGFCCCCI